MGIRSQFAIAVGKNRTMGTKNLFKGGSSLPGKLAFIDRSSYFRYISKRLSSRRRNWNKWKNIDDRFDRQYLTKTI